MPNLAKLFLIFDLDRTLVRKNSSFAFYFYLLKKRLLPFRSLAAMVFAFIRYELGTIDLRGLHHVVFASILKGRPYSFFTNLVDPFLDHFLKPFLYQPVLERYYNAKKIGHPTFLLSSSPDFLVGAIARRLGFDFWQGTEYSVDKEGKICEISTLIDANAKLQFAKKMAAAKNIAYSDSEEDLPLLEWADEAVVVQPRLGLKFLAKQRNWEVL